MYTLSFMQCSRHIRCGSDAWVHCSQKSFSSFSCEDIWYTVNSTYIWSTKSPRWEVL